MGFPKIFSLHKQATVHPSHPTFSSVVHICLYVDNKRMERFDQLSLNHSDSSEVEDYEQDARKKEESICFVYLSLSTENCRTNTICTTEQIYSHSRI